jgi:TIR domain
MKIFIVGGTTTTSGTSKFDTDVFLLKDTMCRLGEVIAIRGHEAVICSPFPDSADYYVLKGIAAYSKQTNSYPTVSIHYPELPVVAAELKKLLSSLSLQNVHRFPCAASGEWATTEAQQYAWLFAQLNALDSSAGVIAVGGKPSGSLYLLFHLAKARNKRVLPLNFLGGAARDHFDAIYWDLKDCLGNDLAALEDPSLIASIPSLMEMAFSGPLVDGERTFFISYARARPSEADYVETLLRRRNHIVYRDEEDFEPSAETQAEIIKNIQQANVFLALWCMEYACSPWCFDEMDMALERYQKGLTDLWIFCIDDTRIVPKAARTLNYYIAKSRQELEGKVLFLLNKLDDRNKT